MSNWFIFNTGYTRYRQQDPINTDMIFSYYYSLAYKSNTHIQKFPVRNFFRYIFRKKLLKPRRYCRSLVKARIELVLANNHGKVIYFKSNAQMLREFARFEEHLKNSLTQCKFVDKTS